MAMLRSWRAESAVRRMGPDPAILDVKGFYTVVYREGHVLDREQDPHGVAGGRLLDDHGGASKKGDESEQGGRDLRRAEADTRIVNEHGIRVVGAGERSRILRG